MSRRDALIISIILLQAMTSSVMAFPPPVTALDPSSEAVKDAHEVMKNNADKPALGGETGGGTAGSEQQAALEQPYVELIKQRKFTDCLTALNKRIQETPNNALLYQMRGKTYFGYCDYRMAIRDFEQAARLDKTLVEPIWQRAVALCRIGNMPGALEGFKAAAASKTMPGEESVAIIARGLLELGDFASAKDYLRRAIDSKTALPKSSEIRYLYGQALQGVNDKDGAIAQYSQAIEYAPDNFEALIGRASMYLQYPKEQAKAVADARKATQINDRSYRGFYYLAQAYYNQDNLVKARDAVNQALINAGKNATGEAVSLSAQIALRQGDIARATTEGAMAMRLGLQGKPLPVMPSRKVTNVDLITGSFESIVATPHLIIYSDIPKPQAEHYARLSESFLGYVDNNLIKLKGVFPRGLFILHDKLASRKFLKERMGFATHVHGAYLAGSNAVVTYDGAGDNTLMHELMHTVLNEEKGLDFWAEEGIPCLFDLVYGCIHDDAGAKGMKLMLGYPERWNPKWMGNKERSALQLPEILQQAKHANAENEAQQRQVALFLIKNDKLKKYLSLVAGGNKNGYATYLEAAFEKPVAQLAPAFNQFMVSIEKDSAWVNSLPDSRIFENEKELAAFVKANAAVGKSL
jgi:tetratricopeptide (TPR) repeat protein